MLYVLLNIHEKMLLTFINIKNMKKLNKNQLEILYECWKNADDTKSRLALIEKDLPKVPSLVALSIMRKMAKSDPKWLKMATRKKNQEEKEKQEKKDIIKKKKQEKEQRKIEREKKQKEKKKIEKEKKSLSKIKENLKAENINKLKELIKTEFFFCPEVSQYVNNISCIFRIFSNDGIVLDSKCEKCMKMNNYLNEINEVINGRQKEIGRHKTGAGDKVEKKGTKKD